MRGIILHAIRISLGAVFLTTSTVSAANMVPWVQDINTARQIAATRNQLILVHFFSDNCPPCRQLEANVFSQPGFGHGLARSYVPVQINVSVSPDLARQFRVDRWPMDVVAVASQANVGGGTSALALARSLSRADLVVPAILVGSLGNALGNYLGFVAAHLVE